MKVFLQIKSLFCLHKFATNRCHDCSNPWANPIMPLTEKVLSWLFNWLNSLLWSLSTLSSISSLILNLNEFTWLGCCQTRWKMSPQFACATKSTLKWFIYSMKGYLTTGWHLVCLHMCCVLEMSLMRNFAVDLSLQIFNTL